VKNEIERMAIANEDRHAVYLAARKRLAVKPAAQVSYAFVEMAEHVGLTAARAKVSALIAATGQLSGEFWEQTNDKQPDPTVIRALLIYALCAPK
jgi:hypothetical protein